MFAEIDIAIKTTNEKVNELKLKSTISQEIIGDIT